ncbi:hypothetical protein OGATHE_001722 [Ogataea polymorpha]|uniref:Uncharacterized protein n=1 Tax=Ogataea polymorpha TaxID=460523 RepID=A0A9P8PNX7_9ASCO|nr:hypothetical protein OGATHE_001722 [Ogataea polymorpha]
MKISECLMVDPVRGAKAATSAKAIWFRPTMVPMTAYAMRIPTGPVLASVPPLLRNKPVPKTLTSAIMPMCLSFRVLFRCVSSTAKSSLAESLGTMLTVSRLATDFPSSSLLPKLALDIVDRHIGRPGTPFYNLSQVSKPWIHS